MTAITILVAIERLRQPDNRRGDPKVIPNSCEPITHLGTLTEAASMLSAGRRFAHHDFNGLRGNTKRNRTERQSRSESGTRPHPPSHKRQTGSVLTSDDLDLRGPIPLTYEGLQVRPAVLLMFVLCNLSPSMSGTRRAPGQSSSFVRSFEGARENNLTGNLKGPSPVAKYVLGLCNGATLRARTF